jgi:uncharacterized protein YdbL (DUF1318 family)
MKLTIAKRISTMLILLLLSQGALALDLQSAKDKGLVGEANTGMLAAVTANPGQEVRELIATVNHKRKAQFQQTAQKTGATMVQVRSRFYEMAVQRTKRGHYYQDANGNWLKK